MAVGSEEQTVTERKEWKFPHSDHLSPTQIGSYLACPKCWELERIQRLPKPMSVALPIGGAVHKAVETLRQAQLGMLEDGGGMEVYIDSAAEHFDATLTVDEETGGEILLDLGDYSDIGAAKDHCVKLTQFLLPEIAKLDAQRGLIAAELDLKDRPSPWPFPMHGRVDALYGPEPDLCSLGSDLKTSAKQATPGFQVALQAKIYQRFIPVPWLIDQAAKTKLPSLVTYSLSEEGDDLTYEIVLDVADRICRGDFPARPGWFCKWDHGGPSFSVAASWPEAV